MSKLHRNDLFSARQPVQHATLGVGKILDVLGKKARVQIGKTVYIIPLSRLTPLRNPTGAALARLNEKLGKIDAAAAHSARRATHEEEPRGFNRGGGSFEWNRGRH